ncbi:MAG: Gfo/Idh/MocA family protein [Armatimonadota bacterium]
MDKLRVGILGLQRGLTHLRNFLAVEEAVVIGVADRLAHLRERAQGVLGENSECKLVAEFEELLEMQPDAVVIASNGRRQSGHAIQALEAGCNVLSEVPGAFTEEECVRLRDCVLRTGRTYMLGENACYWDFLRYFRKWVLDGRLGRISAAEAEYLHYLPATLEAADGRRLTPAQAKEQGLTDLKPTWRADQPPIQYLTHDLGPLLEVLDDRVVNVTCMSAPWQCTEAPLRSDAQFALFRTARGVVLRVMVTLNTRRPGEHRYRLFGTEGAAEWFMYEGFARLFDRARKEAEGWEIRNIGLAALDQDTSTGHGGADLKMAQHFTRAILEGRQAPIDVFRMIDYTLPGIVANRSAEFGGMPLPIPELRVEPFEGTIFWDSVGIPDFEPEGICYNTKLLLEE